MITEDYCDFETAKLLKEKGFDEPCFAYYNLFYDSEGKEMKLWRKFPHRTQPNSDYLNVPTHQMAMKWLREKKNLHIVVCISYDTSVDADGNEVDRRTFWFFEVLSSISGSLIYTEEINEYDSYEETCEAAIKYCLKNLI